ncbi:MAG: hypothetical protein JJU11_15250, partial [Candidatus Sumerlaeia bacterium]|nr:hypothetical protein [Candidatus Sumerlaeia bacterium]
MERTFLLLAAIPMAILLGLPSILPASFTLVGEKSDSASQLFLLKFEATEKDLPDSSMHNFDQLPEFRELGDPDWTPPAPSAGKTSALLAISGTREVKQDQWQVIVDGKGDGPDYG